LGCPDSGVSTVFGGAPPNGKAHGMMTDTLMVLLIVLLVLNMIMFFVGLLTYVSMMREVIRHPAMIEAYAHLKTKDHAHDSRAAAGTRRRPDDVH
jgi:hypothetical protein